MKTIHSSTIDDNNKRITGPSYCYSNRMYTFILYTFILTRIKVYKECGRFVHLFFMRATRLSDYCY